MRIGIDLGGTKVAAGLVDDSHRIVRSFSRPSAGLGGEAITRLMGELCLELIASSGLTRSDIASIGAAGPGTVDGRTGRAVYFCNLPVSDYPMGPELSRITGIPNVRVENDANAAALGESRAGSTRDVDDSVLITIGTGIGGGVILGRKLFTGSYPGGTEFGHTVIVHNGRKCGCGRRGCWEAYASVPALIRTVRSYMRRDPASLLWEEAGGSLDGVDSFVPFRAARRGDKTAQKAIDDYLSCLADGLTDVVNVFRPQVLCLGGGLSGERSILAPLQKAIARDRYPGDGRETVLRFASLGNQAGIIGAACLGLEDPSPR